MPLSTRSTTLAFAFAATLASCADARSGVGVLVDNREGAFLQSGSEGRDLGATTRATLDPAGAAATAAALLRAAPVAPVDATASAQAQSLLNHDPGARPGALLSLRVVGVDDRFLRDRPAAAAEVSGAFPALAFPLEDVDAVHDAVAALGCGPDVARVDITRACGDRSGRLRGSAEDDAVVAVVAAAGAEMTPRGVEWTSLDDRGAFVLPRVGVGVYETERRTDADANTSRDLDLARATDATLDEIGCLLAALFGVGEDRRDGADASDPDPSARTLGDATLAGAGAVASAAGSGSRAHVAASRLVVAAARVAIEREMDARGGSAAAMVVVAGEGERGDRRRRGLLAEEDAAGDAALAAKKFANTSTAAVVAVLLFVIAACGLLAMGSMSFPSDSLLYPREKAD